MRIGQLSQSTGVSVDTLRYYERIGLLPQARRIASGYRDFPEGAVNRIRVIRNAVQLGFPLAEIAQVLSVRDRGDAPCRQVRDYAHSLIGQIDRRIAELRSERRAMTSMLADWDRRLEQAGASAPAHLLEHPARMPASGIPARRLPRRR